MAKLEIPSIVVQNGTKVMERTVRTQRSLSKQDEIHEENHLENFEEHSQCSSDLVVAMKSQNEEQPPVLPLNNNTLHRSRSQNKVKLLVRSHAVREETSPPPDPHLDPHVHQELSTSGEQIQVVQSQVSSSCSPSSSTTTNQQQTTATATTTTAAAPVVSTNNNTVTNNNNSNVTRRHKLRREGSSSDTWEHPSLSRGNSREQQYDNGSNQVDLHQFIVETLNRNHKDRMLLLKIENDLVSLAKDPKRTVHKFAQMSSYQRMLVHRVAAYFSMEHNVDTTGVSVIVNTTKATRIPDTRFRDYVRDDLLLPEEPRRSILKRDSSSFDETGSFKSGERMLNGDSRRSKSFEEREEEYEKARRRIFNREHSGDGDVDCLEELQWDQEDGVCSQCEHPAIRGDRNPPRLLKVESYESGEALKANSLRLSVSKSHSFSGYDQPLQTTRILTKQDSGSSMSSRISPSSSGYKSQRSDATLSATPSPTATPNLHTQTGQPYTNADGSIYHYDPSNPPRVCPASGENLTSHQVAAVHHNTTGIPSSSLPTQQQQQQQSKHDMMEESGSVCMTVGVSSQPQLADLSQANNTGGVYETGPAAGGMALATNSNSGSVGGGGGGGGVAYAGVPSGVCHPVVVPPAVAVAAAPVPAPPPTVAAVPPPAAPPHHHHQHNHHHHHHQYHHHQQAALVNAEASPVPASAPTPMPVQPASHLHQYHHPAALVHYPPLPAAAAPPPPPPPPPPSQTQQQSLPPQTSHPPHPHQHQHPHAHTPFHHYDPRIQDGGGQVSGNELSTYMMGLNLDNNRQPDTRQIMYWQPHHFQAHGAMPVYYTGTTGTATSTTLVAATRYQGGGIGGGGGAHASAPAQQACQLPPPPTAAPPGPATSAPTAATAATIIPQQPPSHLPTSSEHTGSCYNGTPHGYTNSGGGGGGPPPECSIPYSPTPVHMYYSPPPYNNGSPTSSQVNQSGVVNGGGTTANYYGASLTNCPAAPILALQYHHQQPCPHPNPPHAPQGVCSQFAAVYNSCYPTTHYAQTTSSLPVPQLFRKQTLNVGVRCGSPIRPSYSVSPTMKDRPPDDKMQPVPVYGFRVLPGDVRIIGNTGRLPFTLPAPKSSHPRKHRSKLGTSQQGGRSTAGHSIEVSSLHTASKA